VTIVRSDLKRIADSAVALADGEAFVERLTAALPEARVIKQIIEDDTARVITFQRLTEER
jgi:hypothetical protein